MGGDSGKEKSFGVIYPQVFSYRRILFLFLFGVIGVVAFIFFFDSSSTFAALAKIKDSPDLRKNQYRKVKFVNDFEFPVSVFFDDGESGSYLEDLGSKVSLELLAVIGYEFYATRIDSADKLLSKRVIDGISTYVFGWEGIYVLNDLFTFTYDTT